MAVIDLLQGLREPALNLLGWLLTLVLHGSVLLVVGLLISRWCRLGDEARDVLWKSVLVGPFLTATLATYLHSPLGRFEMPLPATAVPAASVAEAQPRTPRPDWTPPPRHDAVLEPERADPQTADTPIADPAVIGPPAPLVSVQPVDPPGPNLWTALQPHWPLLVLTSWLVVSALLILRIVIVRWRLVRFLERKDLSPELPLYQRLLELCSRAGVHRIPRLTASPRLDSPVSISGHEICVPCSTMTRLDRSQQEAVLAHELAHLRRRDPLWLMVSVILRRLFFFQPLYAPAIRQLQEAAEFLCDRWAARCTGNRLSLAKCLAAIGAGVENNKKIPASFTGMASRDSLLLRRVVRLLDDQPPVQHHPRTWSLPMLILVPLVMFSVVPPVLPAPRGVVEARDSAAVLAVAVAPAALPAPAEDSATLGLSWEPIEPGLAAHLGVPAERAVMISQVQPDSLARDMGLEPYDVLVSVDGAPLQRDSLFVQLTSRMHMTLGVVRRGEDQQIEWYGPRSHRIREEEGEADPFYATASIGSDHPFRRLRRLHSLQTSYNDRIRDYSARLKQTQAQAKQMRNEAQREQKNLRKRYTELIAAQLAEMNVRNSADIDSNFAAYAREELAELAVPYERVGSREDLDAARAQAKRFHQLLRGDLSGSLEQLVGTVRDLDRGVADSLAHDLNEMRGEVNQLQYQIIQSTVESLGQHHERNQRVLGKSFVERSGRVIKVLDKIRAEIKERLACALQRTGETLNSKLQRRLSDYDVPEPGVVEHALEELEHQIQDRAHNLLDRTHPAMERFQAELRQHNDEVLPVIDQQWEQFRSILADLDARMLAILEEANQGDWSQDRVLLRRQLRRHVQELEAELERVLKEAHAELRKVTRTYETQMLSHRRTVEHNFEDLEAEIQNILRQASRRCWKLDEPCLDGELLDRILEGKQASRRTPLQISYLASPR